MRKSGKKVSAKYVNGYTKQPLHFPHALWVRFRSAAEAMGFTASAYLHKAMTSRMDFDLRDPARRDLYRQSLAHIMSAEDRCYSIYKDERSTGEVYDPAADPDLQKELNDGV